MSSKSRTILRRRVARGSRSADGWSRQAEPARGLGSSQGVERVGDHWLGPRGTQGLGLRLRTGQAGDLCPPAAASARAAARSLRGSSEEDPYATDSASSGSRPRARRDHALAVPGCADSKRHEEAPAHVLPLIAFVSSTSCVSSKRARSSRNIDRRSHRCAAHTDRVVHHQLLGLVEQLAVVVARQRSNSSSLTPRDARLRSDVNHHSQLVRVAAFISARTFRRPLRRAGSLRTLERSQPTISRGIRGVRPAPARASWLCSARRVGSPGLARTTATVA